MKIDPKEFRISSGDKIQLKEWPTGIRRLYKSASHYKELHSVGVRELNALQQLLYASDRYSVLLVFQAMDAAGKDGAISHLLTGVNPQGCEVHSFKHPSAEELDHDFLWRAICRLPARGRIGVFNRSYYEEVLIARVHPEILRGENIPAELAGKHRIWRGRYRSIVELEKHLHRNGTRVIKFFLHVSRKEQRKRLLARIDEPDKNWKFSEADVVERESWNRYMHAYEACLSATSTKAAPWHVVPADDKSNARLIVSRIVIDELRGLKMSLPKVTQARRDELRKIRLQLSR